MIELEDGSEFRNKLFTNLSKNNNDKTSSRFSSPRAAFAKKVFRRFRHLLEKSVFERSGAHWVDILPTIL